jgi:hypothetical protein
MATAKFGDDVYEGDILDDYMHGKGKKTYPDGRVEEGNWDYDEFKGA